MGRKGRNIAQKILVPHLVKGSLKPDQDIAICVDQVLMQDATGTQACMQLEQLFDSKKALPDLKPNAWEKETVVVDEALQDGMLPLLHFEEFGLDEIQVPFAIQYVDHNIKQIDERNADDHAFLLSFCQRYGIWLSPLGNGICHQVHMERFAVPGAVIIGADSHTTTSGAMGAIALGVGGLDAATVLAGNPLWLRTPKVVRIWLEGKLQPWVAAKDVILELLRRYSVKWGTEVAGIGGTMILEFAGPGVSTLSVPQRATIANMAAELNATALFASDVRTLEFLSVQRREWAYRPLEADRNAQYDLTVEMNLDEIEPLVACPSNPDNVVPVREIEDTPVGQVCVGSSVNSWYEDLAIVAVMMRGHRVPFVDTPEGRRLLQLLISPGSRQIRNVIDRKGFLRDLERAGAAILESACGPCVGMGGAPPSGVNSFRTMNRNFPGRSGTKKDSVYLGSAEVAVAILLNNGKFMDPRRLGAYPDIGAYDLCDEDFTDHLFIHPPVSLEERKKVRIVRGPHIKIPPRKESLPDAIRGEVVAKFGDNVSTGSISPDGVIVMGKRSNVGDIAKHTFEKEMPAGEGGASDFYRIAIRAKQENGGGFVIAGHNYGQGSSREAAAMVMVELGVHAICPNSFARIHRANLIAQGILPLAIPKEAYDIVEWSQTPTDNRQQSVYVCPGQIITLPCIYKELKSGRPTLTLCIGGQEFQVEHLLNKREREIILEGGLINYLKSRKAGKKKNKKT